MRKFKLVIILFVLVLCFQPSIFAAGESPNPTSAVWPSATPDDCPFEQSKELVGILFTGVHSDYKVSDTWYPSWAADGNLYSPWTDGWAPRLDGGREKSSSSGYSLSKPDIKRQATTGQAVMIGDDPLNLKIHSLGLVGADPYPYGGRYPCGSLVHNGVWYYGTYCLAPYADTVYGTERYNWPWLGPLVGFRVSTDFGKSWKETPHTHEKSLFGETGMWGYPVKIGSPHFVDFGRNMEHSPDGKAYLVGHGAEDPDPKPRFANLSWITGDQVYLIRVVPSIENINDMSKYEYFGGHDKNGAPIWSNNFENIKPLLEWNNNMGCVTITYNAPLKKYLMCVTDGWTTASKMHSYILEADKVTGPWKLVTYMKDFGEQAYFLNFPSKFISDDGKTLWLCYSANFARNWRDIEIKSNPPGSRYGLVLHQVKLLDPQAYRRFKNK
ncbi:MAG: DUF4185 domain-containing protein [Candidatus Brocadiia bacterium]|nr:MAG: DUF4185 domain-containing protein [Candidatus Brocadiia bacterium]